MKWKISVAVSALCFIPYDFSELHISVYGCVPGSTLNLVLF